MKPFRALVLSAGAAIAALSVAACERQADRPARDGLNNPGREARMGARAARRAEREATRYQAPKHEDGTPVWAGNRRRDPNEMAERQFIRNGRDFGATSKEDYIDKVHAFVNKPPAGVLTATRANGDKLFYDPKTNTFAVVTRRGAPRTMFKPRDGREYWNLQLTRLDERGRGRNREGRRQASADTAADDAG